MSIEQQTKGMIKRIRTRMSHLDLDINQIAERGGPSAATVKNYLNGKIPFPPREKIWQALALALDCKRHWLIYGTGRPGRKASLPPTDIKVNWIRLPKENYIAAPLTEDERNILELAHSILRPQDQVLGKYFREILHTFLYKAQWSSGLLDNDRIDWYRVNGNVSLSQEAYRMIEAIVPLIRSYDSFDIGGVLKSQIIQCGAGIASLMIGQKDPAELLPSLDNSFQDFNKWLFDPRYSSHKCPIDIYGKGEYELPHWMKGLPEIEDLGHQEVRLLARWAMRPQKERIKMLSRRIPDMGLLSGSKVVDFCAAQNRRRAKPRMPWE